MKSMHTLHVIFRSCTRVGAMNAHRFGSKRPFTDSKCELVLACLNSLLRSLGASGAVHVLDDHSPAEDAAAIQKLLESYGASHSFTVLEETGNGHSLDAALDLAHVRGWELIYFCEDDYLHLPHAIPSMLDAYRARKAIVFPVDYFDRYTEPYPSHIFMGAYNYWRSVRHTTFTFMADRRILEAYGNVYKELAKRNTDSVGSGAEDDTINKIYEKELCVSPLPSLAAHLGPTPPLPPFVDWETVFKRNAAEARERIAA